MKMKMRKKADLPQKVCPVCERPFAWRKKWEKSWPDVRYCSDRCRRSARARHADDQDDTKRAGGNAAAPRDAGRR